MGCQNKETTMLDSFFLNDLLYRTWLMLMQAITMLGVIYICWEKGNRE